MLRRSSSFPPRLLRSVLALNDSGDQKTDVEAGTGIVVDVRIVRTQEEFSQIKPQWEELLASLDPVPLPLTHAWLLSWWRAFANDREMEFRCVYRGAELVGAAPFYRSRELFRGVPVTLLKLAANGHTPFSGVIVTPALNRAERETVLSALTRVGYKEIGQFLKIHQYGELKRFIVEYPTSPKSNVGIKPGLTTPVIWIDQDWDTFFSSRTKKLKKSLKHKLNRFNKEPGFTITEKKISSTEDPIVPEIIQISANSWKAGIGNDLKSHHRSRQFLFNLIESFGRSGLLSAWMIHHGKTPVAFELHLAYDGIVYPIRADYDEAFKAFSPGSVLEYSALKHLFKTGLVRQYYTCADDYWYLSNWTTEYEEFCTVEVFGGGAKTRFLYALEYKLIPIVKRLIGKPVKTSVCSRR